MLEFLCVFLKSKPHISWTMQAALGLHATMMFICRITLTWKVLLWNRNVLWINKVIGLALQLV